MTYTPLHTRRQRYKLQQHKFERWLRATAEKVLLRGSGNKTNMSAKLFELDQLGMAELISKAKPKVSENTTIITQQRTIFGDTCLQLSAHSR